MSNTDDAYWENAAIWRAQIAAQNAEPVVDVNSPDFVSAVQNATQPQAG